MPHSACTHVAHDMIQQFAGSKTKSPPCASRCHASQPLSDCYSPVRALPAESSLMIAHAGTPVQNNMRELWALLNYVVPDTFLPAAFEQMVSEQGQLQVELVTKARCVLDSLMLRRIKADVTTDLLPKLEFIVKCPLTGFLAWLLLPCCCCLD